MNIQLMENVMPDEPYKVQTTKGATFASDRLREVLIGMRNIWSRSLEEFSPDSAIDLYIVDADIVKMFMAPLMKHNYGALLRYGGHARRDAGSDLKGLEARLVEFLGNLIFFQLRPAIPLLLLPRHAEELQSILNGIGKDALKELGTWEQIHKAIESSANKVIQTSRDQLASAEQAVERKKKQQTVEDLLDKIFRSLRGEGAVGELFRFDALMSGERLMHLDRMPLQDKNGQPRFFPPPLTETCQYIPSVLRLTDRLYHAMSKRSRMKGQTKQLRIRSDAEALAHLTWLNELLNEEQWYVNLGDGAAPRKVRKLLLITGSYLLPEVTNVLEIESLRGCIISPLSFLGHCMMDEYFRRSRDNDQSFEWVTNQGSQASALINFFDSMRAVLNEAIKTNNTDKIISVVNDIHDQQCKMTEKWQGRQLFGQHSRMKGVTDAIVSLEKSGNSLDGLKNFLEKLSIQTWQSFARAATRLSLRSVPPDMTVLRNIPPVRFMRFDEAQKISGKLYQTGDSAQARKNAEAILGEPTIRRLQKEDPSHYTEFVCYALFGLVHRILRSAEGCAELALSISQERPTTGKHSLYIKGDEALYLLAHIIRLRVHELRHLSRAEKFIKLALKASMQASEIDQIEHVDDIRYSTELFSIHCHQRYFEGFGSVGRWNHKTHSGIDDQELKRTFFEGTQLLDRIHDTFYDKEVPYIFEYVKQQLLVNLAQLALFFIYPPKRTAENKIKAHRSSEMDTFFEKHRNRINSLIDELSAQCQKLSRDETGKLPKPSILSTSVSAVSSAVFLGKNDFAEWFNPKDGKVAAIDGLRYLYLESVYKYFKLHI
jgi:hypothetical protein